MMKNLRYFKQLDVKEFIVRNMKLELQRYIVLRITLKKKTFCLNKISLPALILYKKTETQRECIQTAGQGNNINI